MEPRWSPLSASKTNTSTSSSLMAKRRTPCFCSEEEVESDHYHCHGEQDCLCEDMCAQRKIDKEERVRQIQRSEGLSFVEKQRMIHAIMSSANNTTKRGTSRKRRWCINYDCESGQHHLGEDKRVAEVSGTRSWFDEERGLLGCRHYARACKIYAECCGLYIGCRLCHDEMVQGDHKLDRRSTDKVWCMVCEEGAVKAGKWCGNCGVEFAKYYCDICKFWDGLGGTGPGEKAVYHCDECGVCRVGKGLSKHCQKCGMCVPKFRFGEHKCTERLADATCPICTDCLALSTESLKLLKSCGHALHASCLLEHWKTRYTCPVCMKAIGDMKVKFRLLDLVVERELNNMPQDYRDWMSEIYCQDCFKTSTAKFHFVYHRCGNCASYNTRIERVCKNESKQANEEFMDVDPQGGSSKLPAHYVTNSADSSTNGGAW